MKIKLLFAFVFTLFISVPLFAQAPFITTWNTTNPGSSADNQITIPTTGGGYNYDIYWEEVSNSANNGSLSGQTGDVTLTFPAPGTYRVEISGDFPRIYFYYAGDQEKILDVAQWGDIAWTTMEKAFYECINLTVSATDTPDLSGVTDMSEMFRSAISFNDNIGSWNVSRVTDMEDLFYNATSFNQDISSWNVSKVENMSSMFSHAEAFNQDVGGWDVGSVTDMKGMFDGASSFEQDISNWDVSNVEDMSWMFREASSFNQNIGGWGVSNVANMRGMFKNNSTFNQDISGWDVSNVEDMSSMFFDATAFNQDISGWVVGNVKDMNYMFRGASAFNQPIGSWDVSKVEDMSWMFSEAKSFDQDISGWDVGNVSNMLRLFSGAIAFDQDLSNWQVGNVTAMNFMFYNTGLSTCNYDALLIGWSQLSLQDNVDFFVWNEKYSSDAAAAKQSIIDNFAWTITDGGEINTDIDINITHEISCEGGLSDGALEVTTESASATYKWYDEADELLGSGSTLSGVAAGTYKVEADFGVGCMYAETINVSGPEDSEKPVISCPGDQTLASGETLPDYTGLATVSDNCDGAPDITQSPVAGTAFTPGMTVSITAKDESGNTESCSFNVEEDITQAPFITTWNTANPGTSADNQITIPTTGGGYNYEIYWEEVSNSANNGSLSGQTGDVTLTFPAPGTYRVEISGDFPRIFFNNVGDKEKILTVEQWGDIAWASMERTFYGCSNLTVPATDAPNLSAVTDMSYMFAYAAAFNQDIKHWDVSHVTNMSQMFYVASSFNQDIGDWNVSNVTNMAGMFANASSFNKDIGGWDVSNVLSMASMFLGAGKFNQDIGGWDVGNVVNMPRMFYSARSFNQDICGWNVSQVTDMNHMFAYARAFNQEIGDWNVENVTDMSDMFNTAELFNGNIAGWDVSSVTNMSSMFQNLKNFNQDISGWDVSSVHDMGNMFESTGAFNQDIGSWDLSGATSLIRMFYGARSFNQDISTWDVSGVTNMSQMFMLASSFNQNLGSWDVSNVSGMIGMFDRAPLSPCNYDAILKGWSQLDLQSYIIFDAGSAPYTSEAVAARQVLTKEFSWAIADGGELIIDAEVIQEISCAGAFDGVLQVSASSGSPAYTWYNDEGIIQGDSDILENVGAGTYKAEVLFRGDCMYEVSISIAEPEEPSSPEITCPDNQILASGELLPDYTGLATVSDQCDEAPEVSQYPEAGTAFTTEITVTLRAEDASGNVSSCTFMVTPEEEPDTQEPDTEAPAVSCLENQTLSCGPREIPDYTSQVSATDNRDENPSITQSPPAGSEFIDGMTITMTTEDAAGNSSACTFVVNLSADTEAPAITCLADQTLASGESLPDYTALVSGTDNCDGAPEISQSPLAGTTFTAEMTVTLTATDASGNSSSCTFTVTEESEPEELDTEAPEIHCLETQTLACDATSIPDYTALVSATDHVDAEPLIRQSPAAGADFTPGMTISITAEDAAGNSNSCTFVVEAAASEELEISCPANQLVEVATDCQAILPDYTSLAAAGGGACAEALVITQSPEAGTAITTKTLVELTATSSSGASSSCQFEVDIAGDLAPMVEAGEDVSLVLGESHQLEVTASSEGSFRWEPAIGLNNANIPNPVVSPQSTTTYKVIFTTENGCTSEDQIIITVMDMEIPKGFSPDHDGINDQWIIRGIESYTSNEVSIYNRWGDRVFAEKGYDNSSRVFTGEANRLNQMGAGELPEGTYFYTITLSEEAKPLKGFLVLKR